MGKYNFDEITDRRGTNSLKYDFAAEWGRSQDAIPLWVADMDFPTAPEIIRKAEEVVRHGIFGYSEPLDGYYEAALSHYKRHFGWNPPKEWIVKTPGVVFAIAQCVRAFTDEGDGVIIQNPVYYPFTDVVKNNNRKLVDNPLKLNDHGVYVIDFDDFEKKAASPDTKMFLLCNPHNPVGRVWTKEELIRLEEICLKNHVLVISDEIHSDFVWEDNEFNVLVNIDDRYRENVITCTSPSKAFNLAGLQVSNIFIPDGTKRKQLTDEIWAGGYLYLNTIGLAACQAAYESGQDWLKAVKEYIWENILFCIDYTEKNLPGVKIIRPQGTYLVWMDYRGTGLSFKEIEDLINVKARVWLDDGSIFGKEGEGFERINVACPRAVLAEALERIKGVFLKKS